MNIRNKKRWNKIFYIFTGLEISKDFIYFVYPEFKTYFYSHIPRTIIIIILFLEAVVQCGLTYVFCKNNKDVTFRNLKKMIKNQRHH